MLYKPYLSQTFSDLCVCVFVCKCVCVCVLAYVPSGSHTWWQSHTRSDEFVWAALKGCSSASAYDGLVP